MSKYRVRQSEVTPYAPANHTGTKNFRLIGPETVGAKQVEVNDGKSSEKFEMKPGEACFFPAGSMYLFVATSERVKVMVIYAPPYGENPDKVIRPR